MEVETMVHAHELHVSTHTYRDDGAIPNNERLPVLIYRGALESGADAAACIERFARNGWEGAWVDGIRPYHHYHSTAHEVLGVVRGTARVILGGEKGETFDVRAGDVVVIPAGVGHCNDAWSPDLSVVGAYPRGQTWDMRTGDPDERPEVLHNIARVPLPDADPVAGQDGPLLGAWRA